MVNLKHMKSVYLAAVNLCVHGYETGWSRLRSGNMVITWTFRWSNSDTQWSAMDIPVYSLSCWQTDLYTFTIFCVFQPKACAQHYSVFLVVNDIFRWELLFYLFDAFFQKNSLKDSFSVCVCVCTCVPGLSSSKLKGQSLSIVLFTHLPGVSWGNCPWCHIR